MDDFLDKLSEGVDARNDFATATLALMNGTDIWLSSA